MPRINIPFFIYLFSNNQVSLVTTDSLILNASIIISSILFPPKSLISCLASTSSTCKNWRQYSNVPVFSSNCNANCLSSKELLRCFSILSNWRLEGSVRIEWIIGNENFPSVKSSQNPLLSAYYESILWVKVISTFGFFFSFFFTCLDCKFM